jgi:hypothetical protein
MAENQDWIFRGSLPTRENENRDRVEAIEDDKNAVGD